MSFRASVRFKQADGKERMIVLTIRDRKEGKVSINENVLFFLPFRAQPPALVPSPVLRLPVSFAAAHPLSP